ncbi:uncharacterized protein ALTATR162_LOCUS8047 [Alternaria atra]|uniref:Uncharacterized protein n=1 Tax=Alternaria atra TaxID=119953 RepID=A0A8J2N442_9PLEO|nr:uncharacterized protein ALTATR162_LOCUS8047 [Alternaria atra]CAG5175320.1 unnamed protein product [Alternaria atra]
MTIPRVTSRVQFQGRAKQGGKNNKQRPVTPKAKPTNNDAHGPTKAPRVYTLSVESDNFDYDDDENPVDEDARPFLKKRVLTTDDQESDGAFKSGLRTALILCRAPLISNKPNVAVSNADEHDHELGGASQSGHPVEPKDSCVPSIPASLDAPDSITDEDCDPSNSLLLQAPLWSWPTDWFPADSLPVAPETTTDSSPEGEDDTVDLSQVAEDTIVNSSPVVEETRTDLSTVAEESTAVSLSAAPDSTAVSSSVTADTISDLSSVSANTTSDLLSESADVTAGSSSAATVTTADLYPAAAVTTVNLTPVTATPTANSAPEVVQGTTAPSLGSWHQWIVNLFAGCKSGQTETKKSSSSPQSAPEQPVSVISWVRERSDSGPKIVPPPLPRLELPKVLIETRNKKNTITDGPGREVAIYPPPYNDFIGRAVMSGDADNATALQRGFRVASNPHLAPLAQRRNNSDSSLLDRNGDTWAEWNKLNITADAMPFKTPQSDSSLLHPQSGARMVRNTSMYSAEQTKGQTGHSFLEDAGHRYPFGGLGL